MINKYGHLAPVRARGEFQVLGELVRSGRAARLASKAEAGSAMVILLTEMRKRPAKTPAADIIHWIAFYVGHSSRVDDGPGAVRG